MFKTYYHLAKPGIIYGNAITATAGFFLAAKTHFHLLLFVAMLVGLSLVIASACVLNNIYDRGIDAKMPRTKSRALVQGTISKTSAIVFAAILIVAGVVTLFLFTNAYCLSAALLGFIVYVFIYTPAKHRTVFATALGSIAGAVPPVVGYTSVADRFDLAALILFLILVLWQMPHFYAIAIRRKNDYASANIPVLPITKGVRRAKISIIGYIIAYIVACSLLTFFHFTGYIYLACSILLGLAWLWKAAKGFNAEDDERWAKKVFLFSLIVITLQSLLIATGGLLP